ncbi:MAG: hypothetical protein HY000_17445 [Planctomycetes bacterium]|nr:hypothetical protein [Planctomycetota bacterium]
MARFGLGLMCLGMLLGRAVAQVESAVPAADQTAQEVKLSECTVYYHASSGTLIAVRDTEHYFGSSKKVVPFVRGDRTQVGSEEITIKCTNAKSAEGNPGLLMYCPDPNDYRFYELADEGTWKKLPKGKGTTVAVCATAGAEGCSDLPLPCGAAAKVVAPAAAKRTVEKPSVVAVGAETTRASAAPGVVLIEYEHVQPGEAMVFTRSVLLEEGDAVAMMSRVRENIDTVRNNMNTFRIGYAMPSEVVGGRHVFKGQVKGWRAPKTDAESVWPPSQYRVSRDEAMRRAKLLDPITLAEPIDEMDNLRVYYYPIIGGHDGKLYVIEPSALAFFIHPKTGHRMTVMLRGGRTYGAVNQPLATTSKLYVQNVATYKGGPLGLVNVYVPSVFYSKIVRFDMEPFPEGDSLDGLMSTVLSAHKSTQLAKSDFKALFNEMCRYTGGPVEFVSR